MEILRKDIKNIMIIITKSLDKQYDDKNSLKVFEYLIQN